MAAAATAAVLGFAPAPALAAHAPAHGRTCSETYDWEPGQTGTAQWGQADWETNTCSHQLQVRVHCATRFGYVPEYSGKVKAVELNDRATCPSNEALPLDDPEADPQLVAAVRILLTKLK